MKNEKYSFLSIQDGIAMSECPSTSLRTFDSLIYIQ